MNGFEKNFSVCYHDLKNNMYVKEAKLIDFLQETAVFHSEYAGFDINRFIAENKGWMVTDWDIRINSPLKWNDTLRVHTYPIIFKGVLAKRGFFAYDKDGNTVLSAASRWAFTDLAKRRPTKIWSEMETAYGFFEPSPFETDFSQPYNNAEETEFIGSFSHKVTRRDTDTNDHVNNVSYFEWAADNFPEDIYNNMNAKHIMIKYKKECTLGEDIEVRTYRKDNETLTHIYNGNDVLINQIYVLWG